MTGPSNDKDKKIFQRRNQSASQTENRNRTSAASDIIRRRSNEVAPYRDTPRPSSSTDVGPSQPMDHNTETPRSQTPVTPSTVRENKDFVKSEDQAGPSNRQELHSGRAVSEGISDPLGAVGHQPTEPQVDSPREPIQPVIENNQVIANQPVVQVNHNVPAAPPAQNEQNECLRTIVNACSYCTIM
ncbi:Protein CBG27219 [Caenorhabditis briggsae]|uniref:Protein CBG27219 n=1 Tax=Caenorhabditis briggsae TaxID=6238 RepID=B6IFU2_CAEBR|nr:Protein CBG27219 [Caenorhabditis briggsae]CAR98758.1 Protein CBG27219 [Caenorhabditis briggsae]